MVIYNIKKPKSKAKNTKYKLIYIAHISSPQILIKYLLIFKIMLQSEVLFVMEGFNNDKN